MVDFNNDVTIGMPASDIVRVLILQRRNDVIEAIEAHNKLHSQGVSPGNAVVRARLTSLFLEIQAALKRHLKGNEYAELIKKIASTKDEDLLDAFLLMNEWVDKIRLTRIDTRNQYDTTRTETENEEKRL